MLKITIPFGFHFATKLEGANNKLVCALSSGTTCSDDARPTGGIGVAPIEVEPET